MLESFSEIYDLMMSPWYYVLSAISLVSIVLLLVYMHFSAKHKNQKLSAGWYICGYFFPLITAIVFISKSKKFPGPDMKVCPACGDRYPRVYEVCGRCLAPLPEIDDSTKNKDKKISKITGAAFWVTYAITTVASLVFLGFMVGAFIDTVSGAIDSFEDSGRIGITNESGATVYYDKMGNTYENPEDVVLYGKDGTAYTYKVENIEEDGMYFDEYYYVSDDGEKFIEYDCYINEDGWFVFDKKQEFDYIDDAPFYYDEESENYYDYDGNILSEEDIYAYYDENLEDYRYYDMTYFDSEDNKYYWAPEASWNEKGELITAENDPTAE